MVPAKNLKQGDRVEVYRDFDMTVYTVDRDSKDKDLLWVSFDNGVQKWYRSDDEMRVLA